MRGWDKRNLGSIAKINYGYTESASFKEIGPKFLRITDIQDLTIGSNNPERFLKIGISSI